MHGVQQVSSSTALSDQPLAAVPRPLSTFLPNHYHPQTAPQQADRSDSDSPLTIRLHDFHPGVRHAARRRLTRYDMSRNASLVVAFHVTHLVTCVT